MKIIQLNTSSSSFSVEDFELDFFRNWYAQIGFQLKKYKPLLEIECWTIEKGYKKEKTIFKKGIKFKIFPTTISIRHNMEISLPMFYALKKEIKKQKKLILHFHEYHCWQVYLILFFIKKENIQIIAQHHGGRSPFKNLTIYKKLFLVFPIIALMQFFENSLFKKVDTFYVLSDEEIDYLKEIAQKSKIRFQTMGIEDEYFKNINKESARRRLKLEKNKIYILYIGRIKTTKGVKELLNAIKMFGGAELLLIGGGQESKKYKEYAKQNKIENAKFLGTIYGKNKFLYLSACDCLVLPSHTEGAPVVLMEAIAKNLPVIATSVGGIPKMIKDGREGIIIEPKSQEDIMLAVLRISSWRKNITKYAEKYRWENIIKNTLKDYRGKKCYS